MATQLRHLPPDTMMVATAPPGRQATEARPARHTKGKQQERTTQHTASHGARDRRPARDQAAQRAVALAGLQLLLGYEWLASGIDKLVYASFPAVVGQLLTGILQGGKVPPPFATLLRLAVLPHSAAFGVLVEWGEILAGMGLLAGAILPLLAPAIRRRLPPETSRWLTRSQRLIGWLAAGAALGTVLMGLSFYLLDGAPSPWIMPSIAFGGALDTGLLLALGSTLLLADNLAAAWLRQHTLAQVQGRSADAHM
jgi:uncharacterized membrane protein YphA (DoxX/SURF4 family)